MSIYGQSDYSNIKMIAEYSTNDKDLRDILYFENIDLYNIKFVGKDLVGKDFYVVVKEIWNGDIKSVDTITDTSKNSRLKKLDNDTLNIKIIGKKTDENKIKMFFRYPWFGSIKKFDAIDSEDYSLRPIGTQMNIKPNEKFYAYAYILPYLSKDGSKNWCAVDQSGKNIENWGKEFNLEHYIVFEMCFFD